MKIQNWTGTFKKRMRLTISYSSKMNTSPRTRTNILPVSQQVKKYGCKKKGGEIEWSCIMIWAACDDATSLIFLKHTSL